MTGPALLLLFVVLPLGPFLLELGTMLVLAVGLAFGRRHGPLLAPVLVVLAAGLLASVGRSAEHVVEALRLAWSLALVVALPMLWDAPKLWRRRAESAGLVAASVVAVWGLGEAGWLVASGAFDPAVGGARGPFSHPLTLGYALLPPFAYALHRRRWPFVVALGLGCLASLGAGPALSLVVAVVAIVAGPGRALIGGVLVSLWVISCLSTFDPSGEVLQRAVLWTTGADLATTTPAGVGPAGFRSAGAAVQDRILPGFHFPLHAHDSALQVASLAGAGAWVAGGWLLVRLWAVADRGGRAALAAIGVGALTQHTFGDLEVVRALCGWILLAPAVRVSDVSDFPVAAAGTCDQIVTESHSH